MANPEFELGGVNHLALVCRDMARTVDFYTNVLGKGRDVSFPADTSIQLQLGPGPTPRP